MAPPNGVTQSQGVNRKLFSELEPNQSSNLETRNGTCVEKRGKTDANRFFMDEKTLQRITQHGGKFTDQNHTLVFKGKEGQPSISSVGAYVENLKGCSYNEKGIELSLKGVGKNEVRASFTDATGHHTEILNLKTLQSREVPEKKYLTP